MNKEQSLDLLEELIVDVKSQLVPAMFEWHRGRAEGFILCLLHQEILTRSEYVDLADRLLVLRIQSVE
ncbi:hypothetical protein [Acinetobacter sp. MN12]|uniref:hypothetical protein n=1 Tax=Acinetobacter sp. MN12 TaxID=1513354 RepID=UPI00051B9E63|nr:hypothetical protein [Acinetobacter sp. MN12]